MTTSNLVYVPHALVGAYELEKPLGKGGMGIVFRARHRDSGGLVALKTVLTPNPHLLSSIRREMQRLRRLSHPGVVRILDDGTHAGLPWYAMELLDGVTLEEQLAQRSLPGIHMPRFVAGETAPIAGYLDTIAGDMSDQEVGRVTVRHERRPLLAHEIPPFIDMARRLCHALVYIHGEGVVHRDIKPSNVFLRDNIQPVLVDFGLVLAYIGIDGREVLQVDSSLAGTVAYMAPEQLNGDLVDARADIFAFGCMLYEGLTGRLPFPETIDARIGYGHTLPPRPSLLGPAIEPWLDELVLRMLAADRRDRLGHASDVAAALAQAAATIGPGLELPAGPAHSYLYRASFAGRSELLAGLAQRAARLHLGRGELLLLRGESGSGKTRLLSEFVRRSTAARAQVVASDCPPIEVTPSSGRIMHFGPLTPLRPFLQAVADLCRVDGPQRVDGLSARHLQVLASIEPALGSLPGVPPLAEAQPLPPEAMRHRVLTAAAETIVAMARRAPLLLLFDDLQWADDLTLELLSYLAVEVVSKAPVLIVGAYRSEETSEAISALSSRTGIELLSIGRLDENAVDLLVADMLAVQKPPAELVRFVSQHAAGNPFFISEYLHTVVDEGLLRRSWRGEWTLSDVQAGDANATSWQARLEQLELPRRLQDIVERRLRRLASPLDKLVATASLIGREFDAELVGELCALDERGLADALNEVLRRQILETAGGGRYRFTHDKLREVAYEAIPAAQKRTLHRAAAEAIERRGVTPTDLAELANHFSRADIPGKAIEYLRRASEQALAAGAHLQAAPLLERALAHAAESQSGISAAERARLHKLYADALFGTGDMERSALHAEKALAEMGVQVPKTAGRWAMLLFRQLGEQLVRIARSPAVAVLPPDEASRLAQAQAAERLSAAYFSAHRPQLQVMTSTLLAANFADRAGPRGAPALSYSILGCTAGFFRLSGLAARYFTRALRDARQRNDLAAESMIAIQQCALHQGMARWSDLETDSDRAMNIATQVGDLLTGEALQLIRGGGELLAGKLNPAADRLRTVVRGAGARGAGLNHGWSAMLLGVYELWSGRPEPARALAAVSRRAFATDRGTAIANAIAVEAAAQLLLGERAAARATAIEGVAALGRGPVLFQMWPACTLLSFALLALWEDADGDSAQIREAALAACRFTRSLGQICPIGAPISAHARGVAARIAGEPKRARKLLTQAIADAERLQMPVARCDAQVELARCLATVGDAPGRKQAESLLLSARTQATAIGCVLIAERATALLAKLRSSHH